MQQKISALRVAAAFLAFLAATCSVLAQPSAAEAKAALLRAAKFFHEQVGDRGCYLWYYSGDLKLREAEGTPPMGVGWVQPPGTPAIGEAFLGAWQATKEPELLKYAETCADALIQGQLHSGGWDHSFDLDPTRRAGHGYLNDKKPKKPESVTSMDDNITTSALSFLMRLDRATEFKNPRLKPCIDHTLKAVLAAQFPNGSWYQWWREFPKAVSSAEFPVKPASYPEKWSREWDNKWTGRYFLNDNVAVNIMTMLLLATEIYKNQDAFAAAKRAGDFLLLAQMPEPQPAWAQQYDPQMQPVWDRKFEPPAISSRESERVLLGLIRLYHATGDARFLAPHDKAIAYLKTCALPDGRMPRYRELKTNKPLYFEVIGKKYNLTYDDSKLPKHYGFKVPSILSYVEQQLLLARQGRNPAGWLVPEPLDEPPPSAAEVISSLDARGAWVKMGAHLDQLEVTPDSGVISCATFIQNMQVLAAVLKGTAK